MNSEIVLLEFDRIDPNSEYTSVVVVNGTTGVNVSIPASTIAEIVSRSGPTSAVEVLNSAADLIDQKVPRSLGAGKWISNGWVQSLLHHVSALNIHYADLHDASGSKRTSLLRRYKEEGKVPEQTSPVSPIFNLPPPVIPMKDQLQFSLSSRRTQRSFAALPTTAAELSTVLEMGFSEVRRARANAQRANNHAELVSYGSCFDCYIVNFSTQNLPEGVWFLDLDRSALRKVRGRIGRATAVKLLNGQSAPRTCAFMLLFVVRYDSTSWRYRHERAVFNQFAEIGRTAQAIIMGAEGLGISSFMTPAVRDSLGLWLCKLKLGQAGVAYAVAMGKRQREG